MSRLALLPQPLVKRCYSVREIQRCVPRAVIIQKMQLFDEIEGDRSEVEALIDAGRPARSDSAHEALRPSQIISSNRGSGLHVVFEPLTCRGTQTDDRRLRFFGPEGDTCVGKEDGSPGERCDAESTVGARTSRVHAGLRLNSEAGVAYCPTPARRPAVLVRRDRHFLNFTCPDFPSAVLMVSVIVAPGAIGVFASPFSEFSP